MAQIWHWKFDMARDRSDVDIYVASDHRAPSNL